MSDKEYFKMTVPMLKEELKRRGLEQSGKKADLVSRLEAHDCKLLKDFAKYYNEWWYCFLVSSNDEQLAEIKDLQEGAYIYF